MHWLANIHLRTNTYNKNKENRNFNAFIFETTILLLNKIKYFINDAFMYFIHNDNFCYLIFLLYAHTHAHNLL